MITVNIKALRAAMKDMVAVVETRNTIPILANVLVRAAPGSMTLIATDLDIMIEQQVTLEDAGKGQGLSFCVHAKTLDGIFAKLPAGKDGEGLATIEADGNTGLIVKAGRSRFKLPTLPVEEFPVFVTGDWDAEFEVQASELVAMIDSVRFAVCTDDVRYYLNGIFMHVPGERLIAAATDGHRLARFDCDAPDGSDGMPDVIVGRKTIAVLDRLLDDHAGEVDVSLSTGKIRFEVGSTVLTAKLIEGTFPDYSRVIPVTNDKAVWFEPTALAEAVERVTTIASEKTKLVRLSIERDTIQLQVTSPENGIATEDVPAAYEGEPITIGFNGAFMLDVLRRLNPTGADDGRAQMLLADPAAPSLWRDSEESRRLYVLMPMRV